MGRHKNTYNFLMNVWPLIKLAFRMGKLPVVDPLIRPFFSPRDNQATIIPVNEPVDTGQNTALPYTLLMPLIERASHRVIMAECLCRAQEGCQVHPSQLGCLFLGEGAAHIHPSLGRPASVEEGRAHIQHAMAQGLVPMVVHTRFDALTLNIPYRRMLTVCFCCDCCCVVRQGLRMGPPSFWEMVHKLPGLGVTVEDSCSMCETCFPACPVGAISLDHDRAQIAGHCKGCGLCVEACPVGAIRLVQSPEVDVVGQLMKRIGERTEITRQPS